MPSQTPGESFQRPAGRTPGAKQADSGGGQTSAAPAKRERGRRRRWAFRVLTATLVPALCLGLLEGGLRLCGYGYPTPFLIKSSRREAYMGNPKFGWRFFPPSVARMPRPFLVPAHKPPRTYRIFVMGGSAALGTPEPSYGFGRILEVMLRERFPNVNFEIFNTAMVAINSHVVVPVARDCAAKDADLCIAYLGNNEVVGPFGVSAVLHGFSPNLRVLRADLALQTTRIGQLVGALISLAADAGQAPMALEWRGMEFFLDKQVAADDPRLEQSRGHFRQNLRDICKAVTEYGSELVLCTVAVNLKDSAPFASMRRGDWTPTEESRWTERYAAGIALEAEGRPAAAAERYGAALELDDGFADLHFRLARCYYAVEQYELARTHFIQACDLDALRFRADTTTNRIIRETAAALGPRIHLVDVEQAFRDSEWTEHRITGGELLLEHCHMNFRGNYVAASVIYETAARMVLESIPDLPAGDPEPLSLERCAELLVYNGWNEYRLKTTNLAKLERPPYTNQLDHEQRLAAARAELEALRADTTPAALKRYAALYERALQLTPDDCDLRRNFATLASSAGKFTLAEEHFRAVLTRLPHDVESRIALAGVLVNQKKFEQARAQYRGALESSYCDQHYRAEAHYNMAIVDAKQGREAEALRQYEQAIVSRPNHVKAHTNLGLLLGSKGEFAQAEAHLRKVVELDSELLIGRLNLVINLVQQGRIHEAIEQAEAALRLEPETARLDEVRAGICQQLLQRASCDAQAYLLNAGLHQQRGESGKAVEVLWRGLARVPDSQEIMTRLAWCLATSANADLREGPEAVRLAERVRETAPDDPAVLDTLAAAYAECGRFEEAAAVARRALHLARQGERRSALEEEIALRLGLYERRQPFRQPQDA